MVLTEAIITAVPSTGRKKGLNTEIIEGSYSVVGPQNIMLILIQHNFLLRHSILVFSCIHITI